MSNKHQEDFEQRILEELHNRKKLTIHGLFEAHKQLMLDVQKNQIKIANINKKLPKIQARLKRMEERFKEDE